MFAPKSCSELKNLDFTVKQGNYAIDPDGEGGLEPFAVYCDMTDKNGVGVTVIITTVKTELWWMDMKTQGVTHVIFITQERVFVSWRLSQQSLHIVNSLSSMSVI